MPEPTWIPDHVGEMLWRGDEYLGCIYDRMTNHSPGVEWRALDADFRRVGSSLDLLPKGGPLSDHRMAARAVLEAHVGVTGTLPSATELLCNS